MCFYGRAGIIAQGFWALSCHSIQLLYTTLTFSRNSEKLHAIDGCLSLVLDLMTKIITDLSLWCGKVPRVRAFGSSSKKAPRALRTSLVWPLGSNKLTYMHTSICAVLFFQEPASRPVRIWSKWRRLNFLKQAIYIHRCFIHRTHGTAINLYCRLVSSENIREFVKYTPLCHPHSFECFTQDVTCRFECHSLQTVYLDQNTFMVNIDRQIF